jgi:hypothetical protein
MENNNNPPQEFMKQYNQLSEEEKTNIQNKKKFDIAEKVIIKYLRYLMKKDNIYKNKNIDAKEEPLIFFPFEDLVVSEKNSDINTKFLCLYLEQVEPEYKCDLDPEIMNIEQIKNGLEFITDSVYNVFMGLTSRDLKPRIMEKFINEYSIHLDIDKETLSYIPVFIHPQRRKIIMASRVLQEIEKIKSNSEAWETLTTSEQRDITEKQKNILQLFEYTKEIFEEKQAEQIEHTRNEEYKKLQKIGIKWKFLTEEELPENFREYVKYQCCTQKNT